MAVGVCSTGENTVTRDEDPGSNGTLKPVRGAVLCRAAPSFLRFGSFELPARRSELNVVRSLADFCLRHLSPHLKRGDGEFSPGSFPYHAEDPSPTPPENELNARGTICSFSSGQGERSLKPYLPKSDKGRAEESPGSCVGEAGTRSAYLELLVDVIQVSNLTGQGSHVSLECLKFSDTNFMALSKHTLHRAKCRYLACF